MNEKLPKRKPNRLIGYDYSRVGAYFITVCVRDRKRLLWTKEYSNINMESNDFENALSTYGKIVNEAIKNIPIHYPMILLDKYSIMPNHIHLILTIQDSCGGRAMRAPTISTVVNQMKGSVTKQIGFSIWQKLFHDHIIRGNRDYEKIWEYIDTNPLKWKLDCFYSQNIK